MKNFIAPGNTITVVAPAGGVLSGQLLVVGYIIGVANADAAAGANAELSVEGVFDLAKTPADALTAGAVARVTPATGVVGAAGTLAVGWIVQAAAAGSSTARVRLTPGIPAGATSLEASAGHAEHAKHKSG